MIEIMAGVAAGFLIGGVAGAAYFGALWVSVRRLTVQGADGAAAFAFSVLARLGVLIIALLLAARAGAPVSALMAAAIGFLAARFAATAIVQRQMNGS